VKTVLVSTGGGRYDVVVGHSLLAGLGAAQARRVHGGQVVVCVDDNVAPLYLEAVTGSLRTEGLSVSQIVIPAGESQKSLARAEELYGILYDRGLHRSDTVVALGGGVIGDLVGFVAATFQRGVRLVQVPTTLLAQVDASVGGKVAVDFRGAKNYVGTFYQPHLVAADLDVLASLPPRELRSGAAEAAKHGLLGGGSLLRRVERFASAGATASAVTEALVAGNVAYKAAIVGEDEREVSGRRAVLNLGHTAGHAIEAATGFARFTHGEGVGLGLRCALWLSQRLTGLSAEAVARAQALLDGVGAPGRLTGVTADEVIALIARDKKASDKGVGYVLLEELGRPVVGVSVPPELEREAVEWLLTR
jgi:3-dehydroquinate synthase